MKTYYIDFEFTKFGGDIISLGITNKNHEEFYYAYGEKELASEAAAAHEFIDPWVVENVIPIIDAPGAIAHRIGGSRAQFKTELTDNLYLYFKATNSDREPVTIITDWFEDVKLFTGLCLTGPGTCINIAPWINCVITRQDSYPTFLEGAVQHNALWDARTLMKIN